MAEVISQKEIDQLLEAISSDSDDVDFEPVENSRKIRIYDFKHGFKMTLSELNPVSTLMNKMCNYVQRMFSKHMKIQVLGIWQEYSEFFYEKTEDICYIEQRSWLGEFAEISVNKQFYRNYFDTDPSENFNKEEAENFSEEFSGRMFEAFHDVLSSEIKTETDLSFQKYKIEQNPKFLDTKSIHILDVYEKKARQKSSKKNQSEFDYDSSDRNVASVIVSLEILFDGIPEDESRIYVRLPESGLLKYFEILKGNRNKESRPRVGEIPVTLECRLGSAMKSLSDIKDMGEGTIIELDKLRGEPSDIYANGVLIARGYIEVIDENLAVRVDEVL